MFSSVHVLQEGADDSIDRDILFDKYEILSLLGKGATSQVYLARHIKLGTTRAIKCISKTHSMPAGLSYEADLLKNLKHPGIPIIYDIEEDESFFYLIEEFIKGESLAEFLLHQNNISQTYIMQFGIQLCSIFSYLHTQNPYPILYQDLKPEHIILCEDQVKIIDFGIAAYLTSKGNEFQNYGTIAYAAPEQFEHAAVNIAADVYGIGKMLELMMMHAEKNCFKKMNRIIQKACAAQVMNRYSDTEELQAALQKELKITCSNNKAWPSGRKHLSQTIAVAGTNRGIGVTHFAVALVSYLNWAGEACHYEELQGFGLAEAFMQNHLCQEKQDGMCQYEFLRAKTGEKRSLPAGEENCVIDCADKIRAAQTLDADLIFLIVDGKIWNRSHTLEILRSLRCEQNLFVICNYGDKQAAKQFAGITGHPVACFLLDENPFSVTRDKRKLFSALLARKEREGYPD